MEKGPIVQYNLKNRCKTDFFMAEISRLAVEIHTGYDMMRVCSGSPLPALLA